MPTVKCLKNSYLYIITDFLSDYISPYYESAYDIKSEILNIVSSDDEANFQFGKIANPKRKFA